ncbi:MAG: hypothetical protein PVI86_05810 [Phycisphaerae bacterium]|jgi:squalene-hopene/tetraprenyl-beta-curcumene cyclase
MKQRLVGVGCCAFVLAAGSVVKAEGRGASLEDRRGAVQRALPYIARQTGTWIEQKKCTSCHQVPHALWAMNEARAGGFAVDKRLAEWNRWSVEFVLRETDKPQGNETRARERADQLYQMLLSGASSKVEADRGSDDPRDQLVPLLVMGQQEDGYWHAGGQLPGQKRPKQETNEVTTLWSLHTLQSHGGDGERVKAARERAKAKLEARSTSLEHLVLRYLLAVDEGQSARASALRSDILAHQNDDGGWGWLLTGVSDALATGQALYGLSYIEPVHRHEAVERAHRFLVRTQQTDGSWRVPSTLEEKNGQPYVVSNDWGTAWAVIGLTRTVRQ